MIPPWQMFPTIPLGSIGWRMGAGEDYWIAFTAWFDRNDRAEQLRYAVENPEPTGWDGFYRRRGCGS